MISKLCGKMCGATPPPRQVSNVFIFCDNGRNLRTDMSHIRTISVQFTMKAFKLEISIKVLHLTKPQTIVDGLLKNAIYIDLYAKLLVDCLGR